LDVVEVEVGLMTAILRYNDAVTVKGPVELLELPEPALEFFLRAVLVLSCPIILSNTLFDKF
jgi:hypothetical protein